MAIRIINSLLIVACLIVAVALLRQKPPQVLVTAAAAVPVGHDEPTLEPDAAELAMRSTLPAIHLQYTSLRAVLRELSRVARFGIEAEGMDADDFACQLDIPADTTLRDAIGTMLNWMNAKNTKEKWVAVPLEDRIVITWQRNLDQYATTVVYNVRDLIDSEMEASRESNAALNAQEAQDARLHALHKVMLSVLYLRSAEQERYVFEHDWIHEIMGLLVVTASQRDHDKIAAMLQNLREASRERAPSSRVVK